jgi:hypothetical protein
MAMKRLALVLFMTAAIFGSMPGCEKAEKTTEPDNNGTGTGTTPTPSDLILARTFAPILANGVDQVTIFATVVDAKGVGVTGVAVHFAATAGTIDALATTGTGGAASATLTGVASQTDVTATVTASTSTGATSTAQGALVLTRVPPDPEVIAQALAARSDLVEGTRSLVASPPGTSVQDQVSVLMRGVTLALSASPAIIPADGMTASRVNAHLIETTRRIPLADQEVRFGSSAGTITGTVTTDATGTAAATFSGTASGTQAQIVAFYGNTLSDTTHVGLSALTLSVQSAAAALRADGSMQTAVVARLLNADHNPVVGARIDFVTTLGTISSPALTDAGGAATATLTAGVTTGTALITASFGASVTATDDVVFSAMPTTSSLLVSADPTTLPADGASQSVLTAIALDAGGNPMPDGTFVTFAVASGGGEIVGPSTATVNGTAEAIYVAGRAAGPVSVTAVSGAAHGSAPIVLQPLLAGSLALTADATSVLADGIVSTVIHAVALDAFGHPVSEGTVVQFATTLGTLEDVMPTDATGTATARLRATRGVTGTARVTAAIGASTQTIDVRFVSEAAAHIVAEGVDHPRIGILGAGDIETATVKYRVMDRNGIPVDLDHRLALNFYIFPISGTPDATIYPATASTNENGLVVATVNAGVLAGAVEARASSGVLISQPIPVAIHGDLPDADHFSLAFARVNIAGMLYSGIRDAVTAYVGDAHGNPVPDSTAVYFGTQYGIVQGSALTNDHSEATVDLVTSDPHPLMPGGDGLVRVFAQTVAKSGDAITTEGYVMWSGATIAEITSPSPGFNIPNGGSVDIVFRVHDANGNPITGGSAISVTANNGVLGGDTAVSLPDTQSPEYTTFGVTLSDSDPEAKTLPVTVTVSVQSVNGNRTARISGTMN